MKRNFDKEYQQAKLTQIALQKRTHAEYYNALYNSDGTNFDQVSDNYIKESEHLDDFETYEMAATSKKFENLLKRLQIEFEDPVRKLETDAKLALHQTDAMHGL